jgi:hypothetical protein
VAEGMTLRIKSVQCSYSGCGDRRRHHENPEPRGIRNTFIVPGDSKGPWFCSIECSAYYKAVGDNGRPNAPTENRPYP